MYIMNADLNIIPNPGWGRDNGVLAHPMPLGVEEGAEVKANEAPDVHEAPRSINHPTQAGVNVKYS